MKNRFKIKLLLLFIFIVICFGLSIFFIQMYPFAEGVANDAREKTYENKTIDESSLTVKDIEIFYYTPTWELMKAIKK